MVQWWQKINLMNLAKSKIFLVCCLAFVVSIAIASFLPVEWIENDIWWFTSMAICLVVVILFWSNKRIRLIALLGLFLFLGFWRYATSLPVNYLDKIWYYNGQTVTVVGAVSNEPDIRQKNQKLEVKVGAIHTSPLTPPLIRGGEGAERQGGVKDVSGKILVTTNLYPSYNYGEKLEITCQLQAPEQFQGFAYDRYLARYDIYSVCYYPKITLIGRGIVRNAPIDWVYAKIFKLKDKLRQIINYGLSEPEASLGRAIILGDKKGLSNTLRIQFAQAGISHIVAISGMHISILAAIVMTFLLGIGLNRKHSFILASLFLVIYIFLIGLPASAMRAGLMGFLVLWALHLGRLNKLTNSLVLAAAILLIINPKLLRDDIGFQLSFLAVLGIAYGYPILDSWFDKLKRQSKPLKPPDVFNKMIKVARDILIVTLAAQVLTLPIIAINFSQVSIVSPLANLLILWTLPVIMVSILVALLLSIVWSSFSFIFFLPSWLLLKYIIVITEYLVKIPYAYIEIDYLWWGWAIIYYGVIGWVIYKIRRSDKEKAKGKN